MGAPRSTAGRLHGPGRAEHGIALVMVLWVLVLLTVIAGSFTLAARVETLQARNLLDSTQAYFAAEAGLNLAMTRVQGRFGSDGWVADGRAYTFEYGRATVEVRVTNASGRIDLNAAPKDVLMRLFESVGVKRNEAKYLVGAILDWRDPDHLVRMFGAEDPDYERLGYSYGARDAHFETVSELLRVAGMTTELFHKVEPSLTVYSGRSRVNLMLAPRSVLLTLPGMNPANVERFLQLRRRSSRTGMPPPLLPSGVPVTGGGRSRTYSVEVTATMPNGATSSIEAVVKMGPSPTGRPFTVKSWEENPFSSEKYGSGDGTRSQGKA